MLRGKALQSAVNSLQNFDKALDKFLAWLSEAESTMEGLESEAEKINIRDDMSKHASVWRDQFKVGTHYHFMSSFL